MPGSRICLSFPAVFTCFVTKPVWFHIQEAQAALKVCFSDLKNDQSSGCNLYVVCAGRENMIIPYSLARLITSMFFGCVEWPSKMRRTGLSCDFCNLTHFIKCSSRLINNEDKIHPLSEQSYHVFGAPPHEFSSVYSFTFKYEHVWHEFSTGVVTADVCGVETTLTWCFPFWVKLLEGWWYMLKSVSSMIWIFPAMNWSISKIYKNLSKNSITATLCYHL